MDKPLKPPMSLAVLSMYVPPVSAPEPGISYNDMQQVVDPEQPDHRVRKGARR